MARWGRASDARADRRAGGRRRKCADLGRAGADRAGRHSPGLLQQDVACGRGADSRFECAAIPAAAGVAQHQHSLRSRLSADGRRDESAARAAREVPLEYAARKRAGPLRDPREEQQPQAAMDVRGAIPRAEDAPPAGGGWRGSQASPACRERSPASSFMSSARNGGISSGASLTGQRPCSPVHVPTASATQRGHSSFSAATSSAIESLSPPPRARRAAPYRAAASRVVKSQTGISGQFAAKVAHRSVALLGRYAEDRRDFLVALAGELQPALHSLHFNTPNAASGVMAAISQTGANP